MKAPNIVTTKTVYYSITVFKYRNTYGRTLKVVYTDPEKAMKVFYDIIKSRKQQMIVLRENTVYIRNASTEISSSNPIATYEDSYSFDDMIIESLEV